jgi:peptidoglycan hydrolase-like protein with peptidoglycan-binding domain
MTLDYMDIAKKAMVNNAGNLTTAEIMGAIKDLFATREASYPDGVYGPGTAAAVTIFQTIMDNRQIHGLFGSGRDIPVWDALIDGKIGRQTAQALADLDKLAMPTVSNPANARKAYISESKSTHTRR